MRSARSTRRHGLGFDPRPGLDLPSGRLRTPAGGPSRCATKSSTARPLRCTHQRKRSLNATARGRAQCPLPVDYETSSKSSNSDRTGLTHMRPEPHEVIEFQEVGATSQTVIEAAGSKLFCALTRPSSSRRSSTAVLDTATPSSVQSTFGRSVTAGACARFAQLRMKRLDALDDVA